VSNLLDAPLTTSRCLSPIKLTLSMVPESDPLPAGVTRMVSGRIIATAAGMSPSQ